MVGVKHKASFEMIGSEILTGLNYSKSFFFDSAVCFSTLLKSSWRMDYGSIYFGSALAKNCTKGNVWSVYRLNEFFIKVRVLQNVIITQYSFPCFETFNKFWVMTYLGNLFQTRDGFRYFQWRVYSHLREHGRICFSFWIYELPKYYFGWA